MKEYRCYDREMCEGGVFGLVGISEERVFGVGIFGFKGLIKVS